MDCSTLPRTIFTAVALSSLLILSSCSGGMTTITTTTSTTSAANAYATVYQSLAWTNSATVTFPTTCTMKVVTTGLPSYHDAYYLGPVTAGATQVATTPSGLKLAVVAYTATGVTGSTNTLNICPTKAGATTASNLGPIGYVTTGEFLFNAYEATSNPALADNVSYTFSSGGASYTASFIDQCNSHETPAAMGSTWHFHGVPTCVTATKDGASGPSHIVGIALDGYPVYGGRDISGNIISVSQLDACNGITSATPEFPSGAYHYVLPIGVTGSQSSLPCYTGVVSGTLMASMDHLACRMRNRDTVDAKKEREWRAKIGM